MTTGIVKGNNVLIYIAGVAIGCTDGATFQSDNNTIDTTCKDNDGARQILGGSNSWSIQVSGKFKFDAPYGAVDLLNAHKDDLQLTAKFGNAVVGDTYVTGTIRITSFTWEGALNDASTFSAALTGDGAYTIATN